MTQVVLEPDEEHVVVVFHTKKGENTMTMAIKCTWNDLRGVILSIVQVMDAITALKNMSTLINAESSNNTTSVELPDNSTTDFIVEVKDDNEGWGSC